MGKAVNPAAHNKSYEQRRCIAFCHEVARTCTLLGQRTRGEF